MDIAELCQSVKNEYMERMSELSIQKKFHFLSRLYLWTKEPDYLAYLAEIREKWVRPMERIEDRLLHVERESRIPRKEPKKEYRRQAQEQYHLIKIYNRYFFRRLFGTALFGDGETSKDSPVQREHLMDLRERLMGDHPSVFALSTSAVNFTSLSSDFLKDMVDEIRPQYFLSIGDEVTLPDMRDDNDARIYFYTHAIINASKFYTRDLPPETLPDHVEMVKRIEHILEKDYDSLSLDHKCEFLVCASLCSYESRLKDRIGEELQASVAGSGTYFVNTRNAYHSVPERSLSSMEHTNVLALMAFLDI